MGLGFRDLGFAILESGLKSSGSLLGYTELQHTMLAQAVHPSSARVRCQAEVRRRSWLHAALVANFKCLRIRGCRKLGAPFCL